LLAVPAPPVVVGPRISDRQRVTYTFRSSEHGVPARRLRFRCAIDSNSLRSCPRRFTTTLAIGRHTLRAQAVDPRGRHSSTVTVHVRILEPAAPETKVGAAPLNVIAVGETLWTENYGDGTVSALDAATRNVRSIAVGGSPGGIAYGADSIWVSDLNSAELRSLLRFAASRFTGPKRALLPPAAAFLTARGALAMAHHRLAAARR